MALTFKDMKLGGNSGLVEVDVEVFGLFGGHDIVGIAVENQEWGSGFVDVGHGRSLRILLGGLSEGGVHELFEEGHGDWVLGLIGFSDVGDGTDRDGGVDIFGRFAAGKRLLESGDATEVSAGAVSECDESMGVKVVLFGVGSQEFYALEDVVAGGRKGVERGESVTDASAGDAFGDKEFCFFVEGSFITADPTAAVNEK